MNPSKNKKLEDFEVDIDEEDAEEEVEGWDDWNADENEDDDDSEFKCMFCDLKIGSCCTLLDHCASSYHFDFLGMRKSLGLDFYGCFKLVNYIRVMVSQNICWSCGHQSKSNQELQSHLHETNIVGELKHLWDDDKYLQPFTEGDSLYSFDQDEDFEDDDCVPSVDEEEARRILGELGNISIDDEIMLDVNGCIPNASDSGVKELASSSNGFPLVASSS